MSKPRIYGTCDAGCLWETVHKEDFLRSASIVQVSADESGSVNLEFGRKYKIKKTVANGTSWGFTVSATFYDETETVNLVYDIVNSVFPDPPTKYEDYLFIRLCEFYLDNGYPELSCEINGTVYYFAPEGNAFSTSTVPTFVEAKATPTDGTSLEVFIVNEDATVKAEDGDSVFIRYSANADGTDFTETWSGGQNYVGIATGLTAPTDKSDYIWSLFGGALANGNVVQTTGDSVTAVMSQKAVTDELYVTEEIDLTEYGFSQGAIASGVNDPTNPNRCATLDFLNIVDKKISVAIADGYMYEVDYYTSDKTYIGYDGWLTTNGVITPPTNTAFVKFAVRNTANVQIAVEDAIGALNVAITESKWNRITDDLRRDCREKDFMRIFLARSTESNFYVEHDYVEPCMFIKFDELRVRGYASGQWVSKSYTPQTLATDCGVSLVTSTSGIEDCFKFADEEGLFYDLYLQKFQKQHRTVISETDDKKIPIILCEGGTFAYCLSSLLRVYINNTSKDSEAVVPTSFAIETAKIKSFCELFNGIDKTEPFMFFTDPHLCQFEGDSWREEFDTYMLTLKKYYNECPVTRVFCGGDWLGGTIASASDACYRLGLADAKMREYFAEHYMMRGNHESNFEWSGTNAVLNRETIRNLMFRKEGNTYYSVDGDNTKFFIFDTQNESSTLYDTAFETEQLVWFAEALKVNTVENLAIMLHIVYYPDCEPNVSGGTLRTITASLLNIAQAYNNKTSITVNGTVYDFTNATGRVRYLFGGHTHFDSVTTENGIPLIITTQLRDGSTPTFDLCLADYDSNKLHLVRVGTGESRTVDI